MEQWRLEGYPSEFSFDLMCALTVNDATPPESWSKEDYARAVGKLAGWGYCRPTWCSECKYAETCDRRLAKSDWGHDIVNLYCCLEGERVADATGEEENE